MKDSKDSKEKRNLTVREVRQLPRDASFSVLGVISRLTLKKDRNDRPYWDIVIADGSGELDGKIWSNASWWNLQGGERIPFDPLREKDLKFEGASIGLQGKVVEFRDQAQYNFSDVYYVDQEKYPPYSFVRRSPFPEESMEEDFRSLIKGTGEPVRKFLEAVFFERGLWEKFKTAPAAVSLHHAYVGGLLEHSLSVARSAKELAGHYISLGMKVDSDIVIAGGLLHDLGKLDAYELNPMPRMTTPGTVVEHIVLGYHRLMDLAGQEGLDEDIALALGHIIVSHHGRREYGSPVLPATPEALIVAAADDLDFKIFYWRSQIESLDASHALTEYLPLIERRFWRGISRPQQEAGSPETGPTIGQIVE